MKKTKRIAAMLLTAVMFLLCVTSCAPKLSPTVTPSDEPVPSDEPNKKTDAVLSDYVIIYPEETDIDGTEMKQRAVELSLDIVNIAQVKCRVRSDKIDENEGFTENVYEILVGRTNRSETKTVLDDLTEFSYAIRMVNNKIVLIGINDKATVMAIEKFKNVYLTDLSLLNENLNVFETYVPDPTEIIPSDNSTGETKSRLVNTKYPTDDIVIADIIPTEMGYAVDPTGMSDSTQGIQKALDDCYKNGGGTVFLPVGTYAVSDVITIPPYVTLRGDWQDPDDGTEYGTIISVWTESANKEEAGLFSLGGSGGVVGLTVYYPHQSLDKVIPYPFAFYSNGQGDNYMLSTIKNITVINGFRGIGCCVTESNAHEQLTVENFKGTFLYCGAEVYNQADVGTWQNVVINNKYWKEASSNAGMVAADAAKLDEYTKSRAVGLILGDLEWTEFESLKVEGYKIGIEIVSGKRIQFAGSLYDIEITDCGQGLVIHALDSRWGMVIARSTIENGIYNETDGVVKLCDVKTTGESEGEIVIDNKSLSSYEVDYKISYKKPSSNFYLAELPKKNAEDISAALQKILDTAGKTGGVVYLPAGTYRIENPITVPAGVELRGASSVATREQGSNSLGTVLMCYYGDDAFYDAKTDAALITLNGDWAGLNGIRIIYPENGVYDEDLNTTFTVRGNGVGVYAVNCMIAGSAYGVDFSGCDEHFIKKVTTCCYYNAFLLGGKNGILSGCLQNGTALCRTGASGLKNWLLESNIFTDLFDPVLRKYCNYIIVENATNQLIYNTFCYGCAVFAVNNDSENTLLVNIGSDNIGSVQLIANSGSLAEINAMRYNGESYQNNGASIELYNRLTINEKEESTVIENK